MTLLVTGFMPAVQSTALAFNRRRRWGDRPPEHRADQRPLSGSHVRRLPTLTPGAHLLAWKLETK